MNDLTRKKLRRSALRNHCKKLEVNIDGLLFDFSQDKLDDLKALRLNYDTQVKKVLQSDDDISNLVTDDDALSQEMEETLLANDVVYKYLSKIETLIDSLNNPKLKISSSPSWSPPVSPSRMNSVIIPNEPKVKLRKLELKPFDGNILIWQTFWDQFESSVHNQPHLSDIDKFSYLRTLLTSAAAACISGLALTRDNYAEAIELLRERFGNKQLLIKAYMESFTKLPRAKSMNQVIE